MSESSTHEPQASGTTKLNATEQEAQANSKLTSPSQTQPLPDSVSANHVKSEGGDNGDGQQAGDQQAAKPAKKIIASNVPGTVKWFNVKNGYGFISRNDKENEDVFVHQSAIVKNNPLKSVRSVGDGETVQFDIVEGEKGQEAANVTGPDGTPVQGSEYAAEKMFRGPKRRFYSRKQRRTGRNSRNDSRDGQSGDRRADEQNEDQLTDADGNGDNQAKTDDYNDENKQRRRFHSKRGSYYSRGYYKGDRRNYRQNNNDNRLQGGDDGADESGAPGHAEIGQSEQIENSQREDGSLRDGSPRRRRRNVRGGFNKRKPQKATTTGTKKSEPE